MFNQLLKSVVLREAKIGSRGGSIGKNEGCLSPGAVPAPQTSPVSGKILWVFYVKECILVHLSQRNIGNFLASSLPFLRQKALF